MKKSGNKMTDWLLNPEYGNSGEPPIDLMIKKKEI